VVRVVDSPIPDLPSEDHLLIQVVVSGSNPKDWKMANFREGESNQGDDIAGVVAKVGTNVTEFKAGDRVAAFHQMMSPHGSWAEYSVAWKHTTFHIPPGTSFEEAAAIPLAAATAAIGLYADQGLPPPYLPAKDPIPLIVYGAASSVGAYAVQLAQRSNVHPVICVAGASAPHVESLIDRSKGDTVIDYRNGDDAVVEELKKAIGDQKVLHAFDAVSEESTVQNLARVLPPGALINVVLGGRKNQVLPEGISKVVTGVGRVHRDLKDFGHVYFRLFSKGLEDGWFRGQPQEVVPGGLGGVQTGLQNLQDGKGHGIKYVFRIAETEGVDREKL